MPNNKVLVETFLTIDLTQRIEFEVKFAKQKSMCCMWKKERVRDRANSSWRLDGSTTVTRILYCKAWVLVFKAFPQRRLPVSISSPLHVSWPSHHVSYLPRGSSVAPRFLIYAIAVLHGLVFHSGLCSFPLFPLQSWW